MTLAPYTLRQGNHGQEVARLQRTLRIIADGRFGMDTWLHVVACQNDHDLEPDGIAGPITLAALGIPVLWGVDLSHWQGDDVNYKQLKNAGCSFVYLKATQGSSYKHTDWYLRNAERAHAAGLALGAYHFANPGKNAATDEADYFLRTLRRGPSLDLPPVLDMEDRKFGNPLALTVWCAAFLYEIEEWWGSLCGLYTGQSMVKHHFDPAMVVALARNCWRWAPRYGQTNPDPGPVDPWDEWTLWQHTHTAKVPGVAGNCDLNWLAGGSAGLLGV